MAKKEQQAAQSKGGACVYVCAWKKYDCVSRVVWCGAECDLDGSR